MKYQAVIFDLFGTLADNFSSREYDEALVRMASVLSLPADDFKRMWFDSAKVKSANVLDRLENRIEYICGELGTEREKSQIGYAAKVRLEYIRRVMEPRPDALQVLSHLKGRGHKVGLISDCSDEIPVIWPETPLAGLFDAVVFSCLAGFRKPDSRIYELALQRLGVPPERCLYVGDGGSQELTGAQKAGMCPVLIRLDAGSTERHLSNREQWDGQTIGSLTEILAIVAED